MSMQNVWSYACGNSRYQLSGDLDIAEDVRRMARAACHNSVSLYDAQEDIKRYLLDKYGTEWYAISSEAVQHIIEDSYASMLRESEIFAGLIRTGY